MWNPFKLHEMEQPQGLLSVLSNASAPIADRHDAAMDLGAFDDAEVEEALSQIVVSTTEDADIIDACGESLWEIWKRKGKRDDSLISRMHLEARKFWTS